MKLKLNMLCIGYEPADLDPENNKIIKRYGNYRSLAIN